MKTFRLIYITVFILMAFTACHLPKTSESPDKNSLASLLIDDFESIKKPDNWLGNFNLSEEFSSHGKKSLKLGNNSDESVWTEINKLPMDWSSFEYLKFDIYNPSPRLRYGTIQIFDDQRTDEQAEFQGQSYNGEKLFLNTGWNHFKFLLQNAMVEEGDRPLSLGKIRKLRLSFGISKTPVFIDNIRLVKGEESQKNISRIEPQDCDVLIDNRNVYPSLSGPVEKIQINPEIAKLRKQASVSVDLLKKNISIAELQGYQTVYQRIPIITADIGMGIRSNLVWFQNEPEETKILNYVISSCEKASREITDMISAHHTNQLTPEPENDVSPASMYVPSYPSFHELKPSDGYYRDKSGNPVLIFSMLQLNGGPLMDYFAPFNHRIESYSVGGGSRYTIETSPVYNAFHKYPDTHRVGWDGWCGHLIKDRWAMGGKKENVVICLESQNIRRAVLEYMKIHSREWIENPNLLYNIMAYELQYICYCDKSQQMFREWLKSKYGNIQAINSIWKTSYRTLDEIKAPETKNAQPSGSTNRAQWYDWSCFNTRRFTDYLKWIKTEIRNLDPLTPVCAGGTSSMLSSSNSVTGIDEELIINEVDDIILNESGDSPIFSDLLLSLSEKKKVMADPEMGGGVHGILLQFLHGKSDISKWWWPNSPSVEYPSLNETSIPHSKEISLSDVDEVLRLGLDVRRLSSEITEFSRHDPEIAIFYSKTSIIQVPPQQIQAGTTPYIDAIKSVWEGSRFLGCRVGFISEDQILAGKLSKIKLLIIPAVKYCKPEILGLIKKYISDGGHGIVIPESFMFDQYAREKNGIVDFGITIEDVTLPPVVGKLEKVQNYDQSFSQGVLYGEVRKKITCNAEDIFAENLNANTLYSDGLIQTLKPGNNIVLATFDDGKPAIVLTKRGKGALYYLAAPLKTTDYLPILTLLANKAGVVRSVVGIGKDGKLITGAEVRAVEREWDWLVYACNLTNATVEFTLKGEKDFGSILDLRNMTELGNPQILLKPFQESLFKIDKGK
jgi:hypothetical protein